MKEKQKRIRKAVILLFWLGIWQAAAVLVDNPILMAGPVQVLRALVENLLRPDFFPVIFHSLAGIGLGFFLAFFAGMLLGTVGYRMAWMEEVLSPVMAVLKSVPVASFVVLLLIWFGAGRLSFLISFLIVFPNVYVNTIAGLKSTDRKLLEMARVFGMSRGRKLFYLYRPALLPYLESCLRISLGMSWKSGVAAEIIGLSESSLGERLYMAKIYLDTAGLFAWTITIVLVSFLFEKAVLRLFRQFAQWRPYPGLSLRGLPSDAFCPASDNGAGETIRMRHVHKSYDGQTVLLDFNLMMEAGGRYLLTAPSGAGKTTVFKILAGLEQADGGEIKGMPGRIGMVFQEDRLCEEYDAVCNILLCMKAAGNKALQKRLTDCVRAQAAKILPEDCLDKPVRNLSGGMRRRVALLRALLSDADVLLLDEPFTGLDEENRMFCARYLAENLRGRTLLMSTHREEDAQLLQAERVMFQDAL